MTDKELFDVKKWMEKESYPECWVEIPTKEADGSTSVENYKLSEIITDAIAAALRERASDIGFDEATESRWQKAIYEECKKVAVECGEADFEIDGGGCDSGDALDVTLTEIGQAFAILREAALRERGQQLREAWSTRDVNFQLGLITLPFEAGEVLDKLLPIPNCPDCGKPATDRNEYDPNVWHCDRAGCEVAWKECLRDKEPRIKTDNPHPCVHGSEVSRCDWCSTVPATQPPPQPSTEATRVIGVYETDGDYRYLCSSCGTSAKPCKHYDVGAKVRESQPTPQPSTEKENTMTGLSLHVADDGTWLTFSPKNGKSGSLHLETLVQTKGPIVGSAITAWIAEQRESHPESGQ